MGPGRVLAEGYTRGCGGPIHTDYSPLFTYTKDSKNTETIGFLLGTGGLLLKRKWSLGANNLERKCS